MQNWARQRCIAGGGGYLYKARGNEGEGDRYQGKFNSERVRTYIYHSQEFYARCRASQELIFAQIPWATSSAERSRNNTVPYNELADHEKSNVLDLSKDPSELTVEEQLLAALLISNEELVESLRMYDDWERIGFGNDADQWGSSDGIKSQIEVQLPFRCCLLPDTLAAQRHKIRPSLASKYNEPLPLVIPSSPGASTRNFPWEDLFDKVATSVYTHK